MADSTNRGGPLTGIKVLDITRFQVSGLSARTVVHTHSLKFPTDQNGPSATRQLADYGAEVVKIEALDGEEVRNNPAFSMRGGYNW